MKNKSSLYKDLPDTPGVYLMKGAHGRVLYVGKAGNLRRRAASYFLKPHDYRIEKLVGEIEKIDCKETGTAIEALILESKLIKRFSPPYNVRDKDDKSFLYVEITKERFPRILLVRGKGLEAEKHISARFGPFTSASNIREALRILRRIFPWSIHSVVSDTNRPRIRTNDPKKYSYHSNVFADSHRVGAKRRPCFDYQIGLCPGTCVGVISRKDYLKNIRNLKLIFRGKKEKILKNLEKEMKILSKNLEFEEAEKVRRRIFALKHIQDIALISDSELSSFHLPLSSRYRIEGYDISDISGASAVGSMVVFTAGRPDKDQYRKFKIRTIIKPDDVGMLKEVLRRRFGNDWPLPDLMLIDGGKGQANAARQVISEFGLKLPIVGVAKGPERKRNDVVGRIPRGIDKKVLIQVRDEAHRFAIGYHRRLRSRSLVSG